MTEEVRFFATVLLVAALGVFALLMAFPGPGDGGD